MTRSMKLGAWLYDRKPFGDPSVSGIISGTRNGASIEEHHGEGIPMNTGKPEKVWEKGRIMVE